MKRIAYVAAASALLFSLSSCVVEKRHAADGSIPEGLVTRSEAINDFSELDVSGCAKIVFKQGPADSVRIMADKELVDLVKVEQDGGVLSISRKNGGSKFSLFGNESKVYIELSSPNLERLNLSGANDFSIKDSLLTDNFDVEISGAVDLKVDKLVASDAVTLSVSGAGNVDFDDLTAKSFALGMSGAGELDAKIHEAQTVKVRISGAGEADLDLDSCGDVYVSTSGAANVELKGDAATFDFSKSGVGSVDYDKLRVANPRN